MRNKTSWSHSQVTLLIELYKRHKCLYDMSSSNYKNKSARRAALREITEELKLLKANVTTVEIKAKFNALRSNFLMEYRKYMGSLNKSDNNIYESSLWYYENMNFILKENSNQRWTNLDSADLNENDLSLDDNDESEPMEWTKLSVQLLIKFFEEEKCLYDPDSSQYHNKTDRFKSLKRIAMKINFISHTHYTASDVKAKFMKLRHTYSREKNKVLQAQIIGDVYEPALWYYHLLSFLKDVVRSKYTYSDNSEMKLKQTPSTSTATSAAGPSTSSTATSSTATSSTATSSTATSSTATSSTATSSTATSSTATSFTATSSMATTSAISKPHPQMVVLSMPNLNMSTPNFPNALRVIRLPMKATTSATVASGTALKRKRVDVEPPAQTATANAAPMPAKVGGLGPFCSYVEHRLKNLKNPKIRMKCEHKIMECLMYAEVESECECV